MNDKSATVTMSPNSSESIGEDQVELRAKLLQVFSDPEYLPPVLPAVAIELLRISRKTRVGTQDIVNLLEQDQVLTADVLRLAQSASFATRGNIRSIHAAIDRIGLNRAADLFMRASLESKIFRVPGYGKVLEKLRRHSIATAEIGRLISSKSKPDDDFAYVCGLLHDVGIAGAIIATSNDLGIASPVDFKVLWPVLNPIHGQFTVQLAALWGLPIELRTILRHYHTFDEERRPELLAAVTVLAEGLAEKLGYEFAGAGTNRGLDKAIDQLNIRVSELTNIEKAAGALLAEALP